METRLLTLMAVADLTLSCCLISTGRAVEANPALAPLVRFGLPVFALGMLAPTVGGLAGLEWIGRRNEELARRALRFCCWARLTIWIGIGLWVNRGLFLA